jgi:hypothetical protein
MFSKIGRRITSPIGKEKKKERGKKEERKMVI